MTTLTGTFNGSAVLQRDLYPEGAPNFLCTDAGGLIFSPAATDGTELYAEAANTYQPQETSDFIWNRCLIQLIYETQNLIDNFVDPNVATCGETSHNTTGFSVVGTAQYNILLRSQSDGGESGSLTGIGAASIGDAVEISTDWAHSGTKSWKVTCDGTHSSQGLRIGNGASDYIPVKRNTTYTVTGWAKGSGTIRIATKTRDYYGNGLTTTNGSSVTLSSTAQKLTFTVTTDNSANLDSMSVYFYTDSTQNVVFYVDEVMLNEGGTAQTYVVGTGSKNKVSVVKTIDEPIIWMYIKRDDVLNPTQADFDALAADGVTDVAVLFANLTMLVDTYSDVVDQINECVGYANNAGMRLHVELNQFYYNSVWYDPGNATNINLLLSKIADICEDCPGIAGISYDDFMYPSAYYSAASDSAQAAVLVDIAQRTRAIVHGVNPNLIFSLATIHNDRAAHVDQLSKVCDLTIIELYRYQNMNVDFITAKMQNMQNLMGDNWNLMALLGYYDDTNASTRASSQLSLPQLLRDIKDTCILDDAGYGFFAYPWYSSDLHFFKNKINGDYSIAVQTAGIATGEGVSFTANGVTTGTQNIIGFNIKLVKNVQLTLNFGSLTQTITGTGDWQFISLTGIPTTKTVTLTTDSTIATAFYLDGIITLSGSNIPTSYYIDTGTGDLTTSPFDLLVTLQGITDKGELTDLMQKTYTSCPVAQTKDLITFDLIKSACQSSFINAQGTTESGKIKVELPLKWEEYEYATLNRLWLDGCSKRRILSITGPTDLDNYNITIGPITVDYDSDMNSDFSDLRYAYYNGTGYIICPHGIFSKVDGSWAKIFVNIPLISKSPAKFYLNRFYGNSAASSSSALSSVISKYDDFEDNKYTGRSAPYSDYTVNTGTPTLITSGSQISGTYSLQHTGDSTSNYAAPMIFSDINDRYIIDFDVNLSSQGAGAQDPYVSLFYLQRIDSSNWLRLDTYWTGSNQVIRLIKTVSGATTTLATYTWAASKWSTGITHHYRIIGYLPSSGTQYVTVVKDGVKIINAVNPSTSLANTYKGFGCHQSASCIFDNILIRPYPGYGYVLGNGADPTIGDLGPEESNVALVPQTPDQGDMDLNFILPSDWNESSSYYLKIKQYDKTEFITRPIQLRSTSVCSLGPDGLDSFDALRVLIQANCNSDYKFNIPKIQYTYEV